MSETLEALLYGVWPSLSDEDRTAMVQARLADLSDAEERVEDLEFEIANWRDDAAEAQREIASLKEVKAENDSLRSKIAAVEAVLRA
jgi:hypothetical protein